jgi:FkbM family methyltransferase
MTTTDPIVRFLSAHLAAGQCAFDIGANTGLYSRVMLDLVGPGGSVHAFEPHPETAQALTSQAAGNLTVHRCAVSDVSKDDREFFVDTREGMLGVASSLARLGDLHAAGKVRPIHVCSVTVDEVCAREGLAPALIKMDTEGHELEVIRGARETIERLRPVIVFEFWETWWELGVRRLFDYLGRHYTMIRVQDEQVVNDFYYHDQRDGTVDVGCVPLAAMRHQPLCPEVLGPPGDRP